MWIVQKSKGIRGGIMNPTDELDRFIRRIQSKSRITVDGKIMRMNSIQEKIKFDVSTPKYDNCYMAVCLKPVIYKGRITR